MKKLRFFTCSAIGAAVALSMLPASVLAQAAATNGASSLDEVIVTASPTGRSKMKSTDSVSSIGAEQIEATGATNTADILRSLPGVRVEASGGSGNANVAVRGLPVSAGGSRYMQYQEDGLPVLMWGDASFATPDEFMRTDYMTDRVEFVRGGQSSTQSSNAPGGVVNYITKTGKDAVNAVGVTVGLGSRLTRTDFNYGTALGNGSFINIGGFYRSGAGGAINTGFNSEKGGQVRANYLHELDRGGSIQFNFKHLDDTVPMLMPSPNGVGDARTNFFINNQTPRNVVLDSSGNTVSHDLRNGLTAKSDSFGVNAKFNLASGWNVNNNFRYSMNSGSFLAAFPLGNTNVGAGATTAAGTIPFSIMDATLDNMGNIFDDLKFSKAMSLANGAKITPTFGVFYGQQNQKYSQYFNQYAIRGIGSSAVGTLFATPNTIGGGTWGALRTDAKFYEIDPYASLHYESGALTLDGGIRSMNQRVTGTTGGLSAATGVGAGTWATPGAISYSLNKNAYSFGGNYAVSKELSVYGSLSQGYNFMPTDRLGTIANNPSPSFNQVRQYDLGVRMKSGPVNAAGTVFIAKTTESNFDVTNPALGFVTNSYSASGLETELGYRSGGFRINSALTYTNAKIDATSTMPQRQAKFVYSIMPSYSMGDVTLGGSIIGTTKSYGDDANTITLAGYTMFNAFTSYQVNKETTASLAVNNLFNTLANTEGGVGAWNNSTRAYPGRTIRASVKVNF